MSDEQIVALYFQRNEAAIRATSDRYGPYCRSIANRILDNIEDAQECVNDTWLRAWNSIPPQRPQVLRSFLAKITRNLAFDRFKREHARKRGSGEIQLALDVTVTAAPVGEGETILGRISGGPMTAGTPGKSSRSRSLRNIPNTHSRRELPPLTDQTASIPSPATITTTQILRSAPFICAPATAA